MDPKVTAKNPFYGHDAGYMNTGLMVGPMALPYAGSVTDGKPVDGTNNSLGASGLVEPPHDDNTVDPSGSGESLSGHGL